MQDIIAGNQGLNTRMKASDQKPVSMYVADMDNNGTAEQVVTYYIGDREIPLANKTELEKNCLLLRKKFLKASDFAKADVKEILSLRPQEGKKNEVNQFANLALMQSKDGKFAEQILPYNMQFSPLTTVAPLGKVIG